MEKGRILLIDDECCPIIDDPTAGYMWYYSQALKDEGFEVVEVTGPDEALKILKKNKGKFKLIVVDIMMPPGKTFNQEKHKNGIETGVLLVQTLGRKYSSLPIIVLTQLANPEIHSRLRRTKQVCDVIFKLDCTPFQLANRIKEM